MRSVGGALALGVGLVLATASPLSAHGGLKRSVPAAGSHVESVLRELRLTFSDASPLNITRVRLVGADSQAVALGPMSHLDGDARREVLVPILGALAVGTYAVEWQTAGADGHPVRGRFTFMVMVETPQIPTAPSTPPKVLPQGSDAAFDASAPLYVGIRWTTFLAILALVGVVVFQFVVLRASVALSDAVRTDAASGALAVATWSAVVLGLAAVARLGAQSYALFGTDALDVRLTAGLLGGTVWGIGWLLQVAAALVVWQSARMVRAGRSGAWWSVAVGATVAATTPALTGHAAAAGALAVTGDVVHVLAAGGWIGSLFVLFAAALPAARSAPEGDRERSVATFVHAFSPVALVSVALLGGSGLLSAWLAFTGLSDLWLTPYGRTLAIKLIVLSAVIATGWYNWKRVTPRLASTEGVLLLRRTVAAELTVAVLVLGVTAVLTARPTPKDAAEMSGHDMSMRAP
ncbi:MAG: CopD family protein [Gemmatimonadota bacterium]